MKKIFSAVILLVFLSGCTDSMNIFGEKNLRENVFIITLNPSGGISQDSITINQGDTIKWINQDSRPHKIKSGLFESPTLNPGENFEYKFEIKGNITYSYTTGTGKIVVN
ncbi:MAG: hypothetical protein GOU97_02700 [Nanoarchaeota archaeon]|nr:hypothetical protein [Nanoarchaeota archaeon]